MKPRHIVVILLVLAALVAGWLWLTREHARLSVEAVSGANPEITKPRKTLLPTISTADPVGWKDGRKPTPAAGLRVSAFATGLDHPRWMLVLPNGDVLVAESNSPPRKASGVQALVMGWMMKKVGAGGPSPNRIVLLRDANGDGVAESRSVLLSGLNSPIGMALVGGHLYVANTDAVVRFPFVPGQTRIDARPERVAPLPGGGNHWVRNLVASPDGSKLYVTVGSASNIAEEGIEAEEGRAAIREIDLKTGDRRIFAYGLRNPNGMAWEPSSGVLWTVVNERDMLGSDLAPDYLTHVEFGGFYGWPWYYWRGYVDERVPEPDQDMRQYLVRPDYALGPHVAALGLSFASGQRLSPRFADGAFIGLHGSWNRKPKSGYKVIFVPFAKGQPIGRPVDVLTGFLSADQDESYGRPVDVKIDRGGGLLVADDVGNTIWRVTGGR